MSVKNSDDTIGYRTRDLPTCSTVPQTKLVEVRNCGGKIEKNEMGGACAAYGGGEKGAQVSGGET